MIGLLTGIACGFLAGFLFAHREGLPSLPDTLRELRHIRREDPRILNRLGRAIQWLAGGYKPEGEDS